VSIEGAVNKKELALTSDEREDLKRIPINYKTINDHRYTTNIIYTSYRPHNLYTIINYINFCLTSHSEINESNTCLKFDSNFDGGNLDRVSIVAPYEYNILLNADTNTKGYSQWFYFNVSKTMKGKKVTFNILNCSKSSILFKYGTCPVVYSSKDYAMNNVGWILDTYDVNYVKNDMEYYTLSFAYKFKFDDDKVYFAYSIPYTFGQYLSFLKSVREELMLGASNVISLKDSKLKLKIKEFANNSEATNKIIKNHFREKNNSELPIISPEKHKHHTHYEPPYEWMSDDVQIKSQGILYKEETLCKTISGMPITLITLTNLK